MYLFFDTETNGLPKNYKAHVHDVDNWPRMCSIAIVGADLTGVVKLKYHALIKPDNWVNQGEALRVNGLEMEMLETQGVDIIEALHTFNVAMRMSRALVAHNIVYDKSIVGAEMIRLGHELDYEFLKEHDKICTMHSSKHHFGKWPKLEQLFKFCFKKELTGAHDAMADCLATVECFFHLKRNGGFLPK